MKKHIDFDSDDIQKMFSKGEGKTVEKNIKFSIDKFKSLLAKRGLKSLIVLLIFFLVSGIAGNIYFLFTSPLYYLTTIGTTISIYFLVKLIIKKRSNVKGKK